MSQVCGIGNTTLLVKAKHHYIHLVNFFNLFRIGIPDWSASIHQAKNIAKIQIFHAVMQNDILTSVFTVNKIIM